MSKFEVENKEVTIGYLYEVNEQTGLEFNIEDGKIFCIVPDVE